MPRKILIAIAAFIVAGGAAVFFLLLQREDPLVAQAKEGVQSAEETYAAFQNRVNAISSLGISKEVESDFQTESSFFGTFGYLVPDVGGFGDPRAEAAFTKFMSAQSARGSSRIAFDPDEPFERFAQSAESLAEVTSEDLTVLERLADTFDAAVAAARADVPELVALTVERNKKTEKQFQEFERILVKHEALASSLDKYSSADFRARLEKLKSANEIFEDLATYTKLLVEGKVWGYSLTVVALFPEVQTQENAVKLCWQRRGSCQFVGPFPGEQYQVMFQKLEPLYVALVED